MVEIISLKLLQKKQMQLLLKKKEDITKYQKIKQKFEEAIQAFHSTDNKQSEQMQSECDYQIVHKNGDIPMFRPGQRNVFSLYSDYCKTTREYLNLCLDTSTKVMAFRLKVW